MIRVSGLTVKTSGRTLLSGIGFEVEAGVAIGVYGPNGAGKSTLLKAIAGILPLEQAGRIEIEGMEISPSIDPGVRCKKVLRIGSDFHSSFGVRVRELFEIASRIGGRKELIRQVSVELGLEDFLSREFGTLSDGEKQWVMLGRALIQDPKVLILDETFSKLDLDRHAAAGRLIRKRIASGRVVMVASHDLNWIAASSDRLLFLGSGKIIAEGAVSEVFTEENLNKMYPGSGLSLDPVGRRRIGYQ
jgi:ABC-type cobalamin/Fe3+-siderophores transport system ATPase subunit